MQYGKIPGVEKPVSRLVQGSVMISSDNVPACFHLLDEVLDAPRSRGPCHIWLTPTPVVVPSWPVSTQ